MYRLALELTQLPEAFNKVLRTHWKDRHSTNMSWYMFISCEVGLKRPPKPLKRARISIVRHAHRTLDFDGLVASMKPVVDGLVVAKVLSDDSWRVTGPWHVDQVFRPKDQGPLLTIEVVEIPLDHTGPT